MRETIRKNAIKFYENALIESGGNHILAGLICADEAAKNWQLKGSGIDREGVGRHLAPKEHPEPILVPGEQ